MNFDEKYDRPPACAARPPGLIVEAAARTLSRPVRYVASLTGGYRHQNDLIEIDTAGGPLLAVARTTNHNTLKREAALLRMLEPTPVPAPRVLQSTYDINRAVDGRPGFDMLILEYIDGVTLAEAEESFTADQTAAMRDELIRALQAIHAIQFLHAGLFDDQLNIPEPFDDYRETVLRHFDHFLSSPLVIERLTQATLRLTREYIASNVRRLNWIQITPCLVHSDFNQKNIIVRKAGQAWHIAGVIDWEFAHAGCGLADIGNITRFDDRYALKYSDAENVTSLSGCSMLLPGMSTFLDVLAMLEMLSREGDHPKTFATARAVIEHAVAGP